MNRIEEMIKEMCPDGVRRVRLGEVCNSIKTGKLNANAMDPNGLYPFFTCDANPTTINNYAFDTEAIIVTGNGSQVGHINYYKGKFNAYQRTYVLSDFVEVNIFFALHYFKGYLKDYIMANSKKGSIPYITLPMLQSFEIPLPSLSIQQEIVKILDSFTALQQNLEDELKLRQKQYEHYREKIFTKEDCELVKLGEFASHQKEKNKNYITNDAYSITQNGLVPTKEFFKEKTHVTSSDTKGYYIVRENWFVYSPSRVDVGSISYLKVKGPVIVSPIDVVFSIDCEKCLPSYLLKYLLSHPGMRQLLKNREGVEGTGRRSLPFTAITHVQVPLPPLERQTQITQTLDHFESLISNLKTEIELRKKQYEYYREKLLTF